MKKNWALLLIILGALGVGAASWRSLRAVSPEIPPVTSQQPVAKTAKAEKNRDGSRKLNIRFRVEKSDAMNSLSDDPFAVMLSVLPDPQAPPNDSVTDAKCVWKVQSVQYRPDANAPWRDVTPQNPSGKTAPVELANPFGDKAYVNTFIPRYKRPGEWKSTVRADVTLVTRDGLWRGMASHQTEDILTVADLKQRAAQKVSVQNQRRKASFQAQKQADIAEKKEAQGPGKNYIAKVQWSDDSGQTWQDAPRKGAVSVKQFNSLGLRVVKTAPDKNDSSSFWMPKWEYNGENYIGDRVFLSTQKVSNGTATMSCGRKIKVKIRVLPDGSAINFR